MANEGTPDPRLCINCEREGSWRCRDCTGRPLLCLHCCREMHQAHPFHRVEHWNGKFFEDAWLYQAGVKLFFGHGGRMCPKSKGGAESDLSELAGIQTELVNLALGGSQSPKGPGDARQLSDNESENEDLLLPEPGVAPEGITLELPETPEAEDFLHNDYEPSWKKRYDADGNPLLIVVDRSGMHLLPCVWCTCPQQVPPEWQALDLGLYPASDKSVRTVFTFQCLDDFLADNQECNTSAYHYIAKLRRLTNSSFPHTAPVCVEYHQEEL